MTAAAGPGSQGDVMCRLFGLTAGQARVKATFWLLDAPDSLPGAESTTTSTAAGIGFFGPGGEPVVDSGPAPAFRDQEFTPRSPAGRVLGLCRARPVGDGWRADGA